MRPLTLKGIPMSKNEKPSFLTRAMINVDKKMGRTPADGEEHTPEAKADVKNALIGAGVILTFVVSAVAIFRSASIADVEEEKSDSNETTED